MANTFGKLFCVTTFGESHGVGLGCIVDGCPAGIQISKEIVQNFLIKRKPGQNEFTTPRKENDECEIFSGVENNLTLGTPIAIYVKNNNIKKNDYNDINNVFRPSHSDYTTLAKYGIASSSGGGRASARETVGRVAAAAVAKEFVKSIYSNLEIIAYVERIYNIQAQVNVETLSINDVEKSLLRCPDANAEQQMKEIINIAKEEGDSLGGSIACLVRNAPVGLGAPVFDKLEADLAKAMLSLPATKSFEIGSGVAGTFLKGSEHNDEFYCDAQNNVRTKTNYSGGIQGGISNGMPIYFRVGFKPVSSIFKQQNTLTKDFHATEFSPNSGRHDTCVLPRATPLVEAMTWLVLADHILQQRTFQKFNSPQSK